MSWTKRQFIEQAFSEIGMAGYVFDLSPEQLQTAMRQLDSMMATWSAKGIKVGYPTASSPENSDLDTETGAQLEANEAIYLNLGIRLAAGFGKQVMQDTKTSAKMAYDALMGVSVFPRQQQMPGTMPAGAGNKTWRRYDDPFLRQPDDNPLANQNNGQLGLVGD